MRKLIKTHRWQVSVTLAVVASGLLCADVSAAVTVLGVQYQQDELFPEYNCIWHDKNYPTSCSGTYLGGNVHVYLKNTGASSVAITDVTLAGYSLTTILPVSETSHNANSIFFYWDNPPADIIAAGEPVWFKGDPKAIPAGGVGQAVVRLRRPPTTATVAVGVVTTGGNVTTNITIDANAPQLASVGFSQDRSKVYLHWRRSGGAAPSTVLLDGSDVTGITTTVGDASMNFAASVINLTTPLTYMSYHVFQGVYADGTKATASLRAWSHPFLHASWSVFQTPDGDLTAGKAWLDDAINRGFNAVQNQIGGGVGDYLGTVSGRAYATSRGYGIITQNKNYDNPLMCFLDDEVDAEEDGIEENLCGTGLKIPCGSSPMGILGLRSIATGEDFRNTYPLAPTTINMDGTFKPENYYAYGQLVDVLQSDPYYQKRLKDTYWYHYPEWVPLYKKATYIYAVAKACTRAAEPNPYHVILNSTESKETVNGTNEIWPLAPPQCKRIEAYYALAAGSKGISYWWFKPGYPSNGLGDQSRPNAPQLWKEMGLYGNEIKTLSHLLVISHPVDVPLATSTNVWARALAVGIDTMILLVVNDNYWNDQSFHSTDTPNATVTATLPSWMQSSPTAFEVTAGGLSDVAFSLTPDTSHLTLQLGTLKITRMIVVTTNTQLRTSLQQRYDLEVRPGVCAFAPELCANTPPTIAQSPVSQSVIVGGSVNFTVSASGSNPLSYQWQKNNANLGSGGHYAGVTTATLTISGADGSDAANYRCIVTNVYGSATSSVATLTVTNSSNPPIILSEPANQNVVPGGTCTFSVVATGANPLKYQWQKNNADLGNGGHYSGCTTNTLTVAGADDNDVAGYRCVVTNAYGTNISSAATLTVVPNCVPASLANGNFEGGNTGGIADGWTGYQRAPNPTTVWVIQTNAPPAGGGLQYQQIANTSSAGGGGVRQDIHGCIAGATYRISGWMRGNSLAYSTCTVKVSPTASTDWSTAADLNPPQTLTGNAWTNFSGTVVATSTSMTLWLDGQTGGSAQNKAECFDSVTVTCLGPTSPPVLEYKQEGTDLVLRWSTNSGNYGLIAATNLDSGAVWSDVLPSPTVVNGTNVVTNAISGERKFYRLMQP
jgi:hypothetical protein